MRFFLRIAQERSKILKVIKYGLLIAQQGKSVTD